MDNRKKTGQRMGRVQRVKTLDQDFSPVTLENLDKIIQNSKIAIGLH